MSVAFEISDERAAATLAVMPWEDYLRLEDPPGYYFQYEGGRPFLSPTGRNRHNDVLLEVARRLRNYEADRGRIGVRVFVEQSVFMPEGAREYRPDVAVLLGPRASGVDPDGWVLGAPDVAVEVLSPSTAAQDRGVKAARYYEQGSRELWLFDPEAATAELYRRGAGWERCPVDGAAGRYETPLLPGFALDLADLWAFVGPR